MRVLVNALGTRRGGSEVFIANLLPRLASLDTTVHYDLLVADARAGFYTDLPDNVCLLKIAEKSLNSLRRRLWVEHVSVPRLFRSGRYDWYFQADDTLSPIVSMVAKQTLVVFHASIQFVLPESLGDPIPKVFYWSLLKRWALRKATIPVTVSFCAKGELARGHSEVFKRFQVIYHGIDKARFNTNDQIDREVEELQLPNKYILSVSTRNPHKNYYRLVQAYHSMIESTSVPEHLVLIGSPVSYAEEQRITEYVRAAGIENRIHRYNQIENYLLPSIYRQATAYVYPSLYDSFGLTPLEAMACGVPCAVSRFSALPEICGDSAEYFDPLDISSISSALRRLCTDARRRANLIALGLSHVQQYSWEVAAKQYYRLMVTDNIPLWSI